MNISRPCRPTLWYKLAQVEQVQVPSWYRPCTMAQGKASIVGIWLVSWHKERSLLTSPSSNGTGLVQTACLSHWDKHNLFQYACHTGTGCTCPTGTSTTRTTDNLLVPLGQVVLAQLVVPVGQVWYSHHPSKVGPMTMSAKEVSEALPAHGFGVPDLYPARVYDDSHDKGYEQCVRLTHSV